MDIWSKVLQEIDKKIAKPSFQTWFSETTAKIEDDCIMIISKDEFSADWLKERFKSLILETVSEVAGKNYKIEFSFTNLKEERSNNSHERDRQISLEPFVGGSGEQFKAIFNILQEQEDRIIRLEKILLDTKSCVAENRQDSAECVPDKRITQVADEYEPTDEEKKMFEQEMFNSKNGESYKLEEITNENDELKELLNSALKGDKQLLRFIQLIIKTRNCVLSEAEKLELIEKCKKTIEAIQWGFK